MSFSDLPLRQICFEKHHTPIVLGFLTSDLDAVEQLQVLSVSNADPAHEELYKELMRWIK